MKRILTNAEVVDLACLMANKIRHVITALQVTPSRGSRYRAYAVPRGGIPALYALMYHMPVSIAETPEEADFFIDDIIDSGATKQAYSEKYGKPLFALIDKTTLVDEADLHGEAWIVFPWEQGQDDSDESVTGNITRLLQYVGEDPAREGLKETPKRVAKAWNQWCSGYGKDAASLLKVFEDGAEGCDEMIMVKNIPIYSKCEHHMADIFGTATIAYIPNGRIVGLSKLSRLADMFARRLQVQERLTNQIADALVENLNPVGVGVVIRARHMCMESRGICQQGHYTITSALRGAIKTHGQARSEFLKLAE